MSESWRVVVVDEDPDGRAEIRRLLLSGSENRYAFVDAATGAEGLAAILHASTPPRCAVIAFNLPDMDATALLAEVRSAVELPPCPIVVVTDIASSELTSRVLRAGAQDSVGKSWMTAESLTRTVENAVARHRLACDHFEQGAALAEQQHRLRLAMEASETGMWDWNVLTDDVSWSPECYPIHGIEPGAFGGTAAAFDALVHPEDRERVWRAVTEATSTHATYRCEFRIVRPGGEVRWVANVGRALYDAGGRPLRMVGTITDITERHQTEEALRNADDRKNEFLATLAHELLGPLAPIRTAVQVLRAPRLSEQQAQSARDILMRQTDQMTRLIEDLLDVGRIALGKLSLQTQRIELAAVVQQAVEASRPHVANAGQSITVALPPEPVYVRGDQARLTQVFANLLNNASKYGRPQGNIRIAAGREADSVSVSVKDDGIGIASDFLPRIFERFSQAAPGASRSGGGLGLGLALAHDLVAMHGGEISARSAGPGHGSEFVVRLPADPAVGCGS